MLTIDQDKLQTELKDRIKLCKASGQEPTADYLLRFVKTMIHHEYVETVGNTGLISSIINSVIKPQPPKKQATKKKSGKK